MPDSITDRKEKLAGEVLNLSRNTLVIKLRFMDKAISMLDFVPVEIISGIAVDGQHVYYDPLFVLKAFSKKRTLPARYLLHMILHCVFQHFWISASVNQRLWDLACDISIENTINDLNIQALEHPRIEEQMKTIDRLSSKVKYMTADMLYRYFSTTEPSAKEINRLSALFSADNHSIWYHKPDEDQNKDVIPKEPIYEEAGDTGKALLSKMVILNGVSGEEWKEIARQMKMDLESFSREHGEGNGGLTQNLIAVTREKYNYTEFLKKFAVLSERMKINDDEFDYVFYTYGLQLYGRMPLIEPLEYKDVKQVKEFVIVIDTSGSTSGDLVQSFITKTYNILKTEESFSTRFNIHVIQCDSEIQETVKITNQIEFDEYIRNMKIRGLGGTDFRPAFKYVDDLINCGEFSNLKGMIYFTDGLGTFPNKQPNYDVAVVYVEEGYNNPDVPVWAIKLVLHPDEIRGIKS